MPESQAKQVTAVTEMVEQLNEYLRLYGEESKKEVETELSQTKLEYAEKMESLSSKITQLSEEKEA